ncbi:MAG: MarR family transcriptional regulator [Pseudonocardia sp.]|uniref:MarR family winged helix-turn-helix transcriptional regulator n=1 Tax=unclassified Pseudonocardia TaxID=2619320 RepID=UPI00086BE3C2|nr:MULTISPECIES: MarR family transcriptional regulator [unclassified Pseudonocardia]MBN9113019.1 MarR family transcriptional regulator [Pseudonocardia sp.]ODV05495.1 MAG: MarR family transcriptional regulator [Pseudonocardia sp. SCN 73-27]
MSDGPGRRDEATDIGVLAGRLLFAVQGELYARLHRAGFDDIAPRHGAVLAYLQVGGIRATELARLSGQHKQVIGKSVDELEELGYVERRPDPADRRAKLVGPTARGRDQMRTADAIMAEIADRHRQALGAQSYDRFVAELGAVVDRQRAALREAVAGADQD